MRYTLEFTVSALREYRALDRQPQARISTKLAALCDNPLPPAAKKLHVEPDHFRIRVGDYRAVYRVDGRRVVVVIVRIRHRREVYR